MWVLHFDFHKFYKIHIWHVTSCNDALSVLILILNWSLRPSRYFLMSYVTCQWCPLQVKNMLCNKYWVDFLCSTSLILVLDMMRVEKDNFLRNVLIFSSTLKLNCCTRYFASLHFPTHASDVFSRYTFLCFCITRRETFGRIRRIFGSMMKNLIFLKLQWAMQNFNFYF